MRAGRLEEILQSTPHDDSVDNRAEGVNSGKALNRLVVSLNSSCMGLFLLEVRRQVASTKKGRKHCPYPWASSKEELQRELRSVESAVGLAEHLVNGASQSWQNRYRGQGEKHQKQRILD